MRVFELYLSAAEIVTSAMRKRRLCRYAVSVRLSVCLSRSCILLKRINTSSKFFESSDSHTILAFAHRNLREYSNGDPVTRTSNAGEVGKKSRFSTTV